MERFVPDSVVSRVRATGFAVLVESFSTEPVRIGAVLPVSTVAGALLLASMLAYWAEMKASPLANASLSRSG